MGDLANARVMYSKGLELASRSDSRASTGHEDPRYIECLSMLNQIQEVETALHSLPATLETPDDVRHAIRVYLAVQSKCSCWREMYLTLSRDYLLLNDLASAELLLSRITPQLLPGFHDSTIYPFSIAAWDAEKLDIFGNDVSAVDEEIVQRWIELFVLQNRIQRADWLLQKCSLEPRFRETQRNSAGLTPFWGIGELEVRFSGLFLIRRNIWRQRRRRFPAGILWNVRERRQPRGNGFDRLTAGMEGPRGSFIRFRRQNSAVFLSI